MVKSSAYDHTTFIQVQKSENKIYLWTILYKLIIQELKQRKKI